MTQVDPLVEFMRRANCPSKEWTVAADLPWTTVTVPRHKNILTIGDRPSHLFLILDGWAGRYSLRRTGTRRVTGFMVRGDLCGIHALTGAKMDHSVIALSECKIARVPAAEIEPVIRSTPSLGRALWHSKLMEEAILRKWLLNSENAELSISHFFCEMHARLSAPGLASQKMFEIPITQADIGDALGITSVHTNRMLRHLRDAGLVTVSRGTVIIEDLEKLRRHCHFDPSYLHL